MFFFEKGKSAGILLSFFSEEFSKGLSFSIFLFSEHKIPDFLLYFFVKFAQILTQSNSRIIYSKGLFKLYQERLDKEWGLTDCMSFLVMKDYDLRQALTADKHFQQAGFRINSTIKNLPPAAFVGLSPL